MVDLRFWRKHKVLPIPVEVQEAAARGAALLDAHRQGWWQLIDGNTLDLLHPFRCVLGQVYGSYLRGLRAVGMLNESAVNVEDFGFCPTTQPGSPELLRRAWVAEVAKRQAVADASA